jgi:hypothetical protein
VELQVVSGKDDTTIVPFRFADSRDSESAITFPSDSFKHLTWAPNGRMLVVGSGATLADIRIEQWPSLGGRNVEVIARRLDQSEPYEPQWWE